MQRREKLLVIVEGRNGAGRDRLIKWVTKHMSPWETRVVAPFGKPSDRDRKYIERWVAHLPASAIVFFSRLYLPDGSTARA